MVTLRQMTKTESVVKASMVDNVRRAGGYARRYEDQFAVGIPDTIFILPSLPPIFAEVKVFKHHRFGPTDRQLVELNRLNQHSPRVFGILIGWKDNIYYFSEARSVAIDTDCFSVTRCIMPFADQLRQFYHARLMCPITEK